METALARRSHGRWAAAVRQGSSAAIAHRYAGEPWRTPGTRWRVPGVRCVPELTRYLGGNCEWGAGSARLAVGAVAVKPMTAQLMFTPTEP